MSKFINCPAAIDMYPKNHAKHVTTIFPQNVEFLNAKENVLQSVNGNFNTYTPNCCFSPAYVSLWPT
jgi:hypothetical protein